MQFIDDDRWREQLAINPAQFFRAKSQTLITAIPRFNRPPNMQSYLGYTAPAYADYTYAVKETDTFPLTIETGAIPYDLCSVGYIGNDGEEYVRIAEFTYTKSTGSVTINDPLPEGTVIDIDFYTDGVFTNALDPTQQRLLGLCMAYDWYYRFENAFLNVLNPITDKTFSPRSATAEDKRANTGRYMEIGRQLSSELLAYEQRLYAMKYIQKGKLDNLIVGTNVSPTATEPSVWVDGDTVFVRSRNVGVDNGTLNID